MFSLESFYSILYSNLLRPANFYYQYFDPFGSTDVNDLANFQDIYWEESYHDYYHMRHTCIAWDQEPLLESSLKHNFYKHANKKYCRLFANSERSEFKNRFIQNNHYMNWYYFYHGFAALAWYNDLQYMQLENHFTKIFMSLNRLWKDNRNYRLELISKIKEKNLLGVGHVSLHAKDFNEIKIELFNQNNKLSTNSKKLIYTELKTQQFPMVADYHNILGTASATGSLIDLKFNRSALWHLVSETIFYHDKLHLTEKIFKPIVSKRPFILVGATGNLKYLKDYGFQTFDHWIDESYDTITDGSDRINAIIDQLHKITSMDDSSLKTMHNEMQEVLDYNYNHFYGGKFRYQISKELVDNFRGCCVAWNQNCTRDTDMVSIWNVDFDSALETLLR